MRKRKHGGSVGVYVLEQRKVGGAYKEENVFVYNKQCVYDGRRGNACLYMWWNV